MNKKGQGLPLNTIVVAILVVVVLVVIVAFFLGGTTSLTNSMKRIFFGTTAGTDINLAVETCRQYCTRAEDLPTTELQQRSAYCTQYFAIDTTRNGDADLVDQERNIYQRWYCGSTYPTAFSEKGQSYIPKHLSVPCSVECPSTAV